MDMFTKSSLMMFVLLNPFIMSVYLIEILRTLPFPRMAGQLLRAGVISLSVLLLFAWLGERVFEDILQVRFSSFMVFGGLIYLLIGIRLIMGIGPPVDLLKTGSGNLSAVIAMPFIIGPGTISTSVLAGTRLPFPLAALAIALALGVALASILAIKLLHDAVQARHERYVQLYSEVAGRATALFTGTFAIEMIITGTERWLADLPDVG